MTPHEGHFPETDSPILVASFTNDDPLPGLLVKSPSFPHEFKILRRPPESPRISDGSSRYRAFCALSSSFHSLCASHIRAHALASCLEMSTVELRSMRRWVFNKQSSVANDFLSITNGQYSSSRSITSMFSNSLSSYLRPNCIIESTKSQALRAVEMPREKSPEAKASLATASRRSYSSRSASNSALFFAICRPLARLDVLNLPDAIEKRRANVPPGRSIIPRINPNPQGD